MHIFLDAPATRKLAVVKSLVGQKGPLPLTELTSSLAISKATLKKDLAELVNDIAKLNSTAVLTYQDKGGRDLQLTQAELFLSDNLTSLYINSDFIFQNLQDILLNQNHVFKTFYEDQFVSTSTAYRKLNEMKRLLEKFELTLDYSQDFPIIGKESQIRYFYVCLFWSAYDGKTWHFKDSREKIEEILIELCGKAYDEIALGRREFYLIWLAVFLQRLRLGSPINVLLNATANYHLSQEVGIRKATEKVMHQGEFDAEKVTEIKGELSYIYDLYRLFDADKAAAAREKLAAGDLTEVVQKIVYQLEEQLVSSFSLEQFNYLYGQLLNYHLKCAIFSGSEADFFVTLQSPNQLSPQSEFQGVVKRILLKVVSDVTSKSVIDPSLATLSYYTEALFETLGLNDGLLKVKVGIFSVANEQGLRSYQKIIKQNGFELIEFVTDLKASRELNITDKYFKEVIEEELPLIVVSFPPRDQEVNQLKAYYWATVLQKFKASFRA